MEIWLDHELNVDRGQRIALESGFLPLSTEDRTGSIDGINNTSDIDVFGYKVYRDGTNWTVIVPEVKATILNDTGAVAGMNYTYTITAVFAAGEGARSRR